MIVFDLLLKHNSLPVNYDFFILNIPFLNAMNSYFKAINFFKVIFIIYVRFPYKQLKY